VNRISLKYRIALTIFVLEVIMVSLVLWKTQTSYYDAVKNMHFEQENVFLNVLSDFSSKALTMAEYGDLQHFINELVMNQHVMEISVSNDDNRVVASTDLEMLGKRLLFPDKEEGAYWKSRKLSIEQDGVGFIAMKFSSTDIEEAYSHALILGIAIAGISMTIIAVVAVMIGNYLVRRLDRLTETAQKMADGDLSATTEISGSDEVARLSRTFNEMARKIESGVKALSDREEEVREHRDNLEVMVARRTSELDDINKALMDEIEKRVKMEEEVLRSQKLEAIGILAGGIAHDFNNLLTAVLNTVYLAKMAVNPEEKAFEKMETAENVLENAKTLTQQLLTFSKGGEPVKEAVHLEKVIKDTVSFALRGSNVKCSFDIYNKLWPVEVDTGQISQVIGNLVINATQAMPQGGGIKVYADNDVLDKRGALPLEVGRYLRLSIEDSGHGIATEHIYKIFDPYFTTKQKGSGLGLASSYSVIRNHGGHISVESELGIGTTFHVYLPATDRQPEDREETRVTALDCTGRVLLMEDDTVIARSVVEGLKMLGFDAMSAKNGNEAINLFQNARESNDPFDVIILDLTIPGGMGGKETIKILLEIDPEVKAIVASGYSNDPVMSKFRDYGFNGVIPKPYMIEDLADSLRKIISG
jgi:signal transduction histidine kinase/ActR/RegA family two-component response regulator